VARNADILSAPGRIHAAILKLNFRTDALQPSTRDGAVC
jgi:hypothetical protein